MHPQVTPFFHKQSNTWTYLVSDPASTAAAIIDPCLDFDAKSGRTGTASAQAVLARIEADGLDLRWILETHAHADHLSAGRWLKTRRPQARLAIGQGIREVQRSFQPVFNLGPDFATDGRQFDQLFDDGEEFAIGGLSARVIATPGHTNDSVSYLIGDALFVGDTLFMPDFGTARCDFPGGDAATLFRSIQRLMALPDDARVFLCHDYKAPGRDVYAWQTSVGAERRENIHVREGVTEADFVAMRKARDATLPMPVLLLPSVQVNMRAGHLPEPEHNGVRYLKLPVDAL